MHMNENLFFSTSMFIVILIYTGISIALFVAYKILKKFSDYGDSSCDMKEYSRWGIDYRRRADDVPSQDKRILFADYGVNPYEGRKHSIPEQLLKNADKVSDEGKFDMEMKKYT